MNPNSEAATLVAIATYNEIENLPRLAAEIFACAPDVHLLVVDDASPDGTGQWADERSRQDPRLRVLHRHGKLGLGTAMVAGMKYSIERGYQHHVSMDADFSHHPRYLPALLAAMGPAEGPRPDIAIGSRYIRGGAIEGWSFKRHLMSRGINWYTHFMLRLKPRDCSGGYRCYRVDRLAELDLDRLKSHGYAFVEEVLWRLVRNGCRAVEIPITFVDRVQGNSKINLREVAEAVRVISLLGLQNLRRPRPANRAPAASGSREPASTRDESDSARGPALERESVP